MVQCRRKSVSVPEITNVHTRLQKDEIHSLLVVVCYDTQT